MYQNKSNINIWSQFACRNSDKNFSNNGLKIVAKNQNLIML